MTARPSAPATDFGHWLSQAVEDRSAGRLTAGLRHAQAALAAASQPQQRADAYRLLCFFMFRAGHLDTLANEGEAWLVELGDTTSSEARLEVLRYLGGACVEIGHHERAVRHAKAACALAREAGRPDWVVRALNGSAVCLLGLGDVWQAAPLLDEALALAQSLDSPFDLLITLNNLAGTAIDAFHLLRDGVDAEAAQAQLHRARRALEQAIGLLGSAKDPLARAFIQGNLGEVLSHLGELTAGEALLNQALAVATEHGQAVQVARIRCNIADNHWRQGQLESARRNLQALHDGPDRPQDKATQLVLHRLLARVCRSQGDLEPAFFHLEQAEITLRRKVAHQLQTQALLLVSRETAEQAHHARRAAQAQADLWAEQANRDALTGLANRRLVDHAWPALIQQAQQQGTPLSVALVDLDHFKQINDRFGHRLGDAVLVAMARMLLTLTRERDVAARIGGEEFLLLLPGTDLDGARLLGERLRRAVMDHDWHALAPGLAVTVSVGLAQSPPLDAQTLFDLADRALYTAKLSGRNRVVAA